MLSSNAPEPYFLHGRLPIGQRSRQAPKKRQTTSSMSHGVRHTLNVTQHVLLGGNCYSHQFADTCRAGVPHTLEMAIWWLHTTESTCMAGPGLRGLRGAHLLQPGDHRNPGRVACPPSCGAESSPALSAIHRCEQGVLRWRLIAGVRRQCSSCRRGFRCSCGLFNLKHCLTHKRVALQGRLLLPSVEAQEDDVAALRQWKRSWLPPSNTRATVLQVLGGPCSRSVVRLDTFAVSLCRRDDVLCCKTNVVDSVVSDLGSLCTDNYRQCSVSLSGADHCHVGLTLLYTVRRLTERLGRVATKSSGMFTPLACVGLQLHQTAYHDQLIADTGHTTRRRVRAEPM